MLLYDWLKYEQFSVHYLLDFNLYGVELQLVRQFSGKYATGLRKISRYIRLSWVMTSKPVEVWVPITGLHYVG